MKWRWWCLMYYIFVSYLCLPKLTPGCFYNYWFCCRRQYYCLFFMTFDITYIILLYKHQWNTKWAFARKLDIFTCENNMLPSHVKISPLLWLHNKLHRFRPKNYLSEMVWHFTGVYIISRTLHGRLEIRTFSSRFEKNILLFGANIFQHSKRNFVSPCGHVISSI